MLSTKENFISLKDDGNPISWQGRACMENTRHKKNDKHVSRSYSTKLAAICNSEEESCSRFPPTIAFQPADVGGEIPAVGNAIFRLAFISQRMLRGIRQVLQPAGRRGMSPAILPGYQEQPTWLYGAGLRCSAGRCTGENFRCTFCRNSIASLTPLRNRG